MAATIAANLDCVAAAAPAATAPGTNGHVPTRVPTSPTPDPRDGSARAGSAPAPASKYRPGTEPTHQTGHSGHHDPVRTRRVPDGDILAWLSEQTATTGKVPGRRKVIDKWAIGSPRADRLRRIIHTETATNATTASAR